LCWFYSSKDKKDEKTAIGSKNILIMYYFFIYMQIKIKNRHKEHTINFLVAMVKNKNVGDFFVLFL